MSAKTIHIFSIIPRISETFVRAFPNQNIKTVVMKEYLKRCATSSDDIMKKYEKQMSEEEIMHLVDAEILITDGHLIPQMYDRLQKLKWIQCTWAGVEKIAAVFKDGPRPSFSVSRMGSPVFGQLMAEYTIGWIICHERAWLDALKYQSNSEWAHRDRIATYRSLSELTVGVLGVGLIGKEIAKLLKSLNCTVYGLGRRSSCSEDTQVDKYWTSNELPEFLSNCDYIVNVLPSTPDTCNMLGGGILKHAKSSSVLINIGRATIINEQDLLTALGKGWISKAILDVFAEEPLPSTSPYWQHPQIIVTPHAAGVTRAQDVVEAFSSNFDRYCEGLPLLNTVDWDRGY